MTHTAHTAESIGNQFGYVCPKCKTGDQLQITAMITAMLQCDGVDHDLDTEWDSDSPAHCRNCGWTGIQGQFHTVELDD